MKKFLLVPAFLLLAACGFQPVYGTHENRAPVAAMLNNVTIDNIPNRQGQMLRNDLIDRMYGNGRPSLPQYHLSIILTTNVQDLGIQANATSTRSLMDTTATFTLFDAKGVQVLQGTAHSITSFNKLLDQYGSLAAKEDATKRTVNEVGEQIVNRLNIFFADGPLNPDDAAKSETKN